MLSLLASVALGRTLCLLAIFLGIGLIVNVAIVVAVIGVMGEHRQNVARRHGHQ
jgi:hypothetical protein